MMGFVKTQQEIDHYFSLAVRKFPDTDMLGMLYQTDPEAIKRLLPPPLEPAAEPWALIYICHFKDTNLGPGYRESALFIRCQYKGEVGNYCLGMPLDGNDDRIFNGREIYGFPKKTASITLKREGNVAEGWVERRGIRFAHVKAQLMTKMDQPPLKTGPSFLFKFLPKADLTPGFAGKVELVRQRTEIEYKCFEMGSGTVEFQDSPFDPWSEVPCKSVIGCYYFTGDTTMQPGDVVGEADPDAFLPYSFSRTDWGYEK
jgi:acetoacetate decarboxylase